MIFLHSAEYQTRASSASKTPGTLPLSYTPAVDYVRTILILGSFFLEELSTRKCGVFDFLGYLFWWYCA